MTDLIERLRAQAHDAIDWSSVESLAELIAEAADRIEELERQAGRAHEAWLAAERRIDELETALMSIRSNANCHTADLALATIPLIFDIATRAIRDKLELLGGCHAD